MRFKIFFFENVSAFVSGPFSVKLRYWLRCEWSYIQAVSSLCGCFAFSLKIMCFRASSQPHCLLFLHYFFFNIRVLFTFNYQTQIQLSKTNYDVILSWTVQIFCKIFFFAKMLDKFERPTKLKLKFRSRWAWHSLTSSCTCSIVNLAREMRNWATRKNSKLGYMRRPSSNIRTQLVQVRYDGLQVRFLQVRYDGLHIQKWAILTEFESHLWLSLLPMLICY